MTIAGGWDVSIDGIPLMIHNDEPDEPGYEQSFESLFAPTSAIAGEIAKEQIRPEKLLWSITDWSGGEGNIIYYPQDPTTYDVGSLVNPTSRGKLTTRPRRYRSAVARAGSNADTQKRPFGTSCFTHALIAWEDNIVQSTNAIGWATVQDTTPAGSTISWSDAITDGTNAAFLQSELNGSAGVIPVVQADASTATWADMDSGTTIAGPKVGCVLDGVPYVFGYNGGLKLYKKAAVMDSAADWSATTVFTTGIDPSGIWGHDYWTDCEAAETSLFFSYATESITYVWESRSDVGRPFWTSPQGFAGKRLIYSSGILFIAGNQTSSNGRRYGRIWAIPLQTRQPVKINVRSHANEQLTDLSVGCPGPEDGIFVADASAGKIFYYDIQKDAIHLFDDLVNGGTGDSMDFVDSTNLLDSAQTDMELGGSGGQGRIYPTGTTGVCGWFGDTNATVGIEQAVEFSGDQCLEITSAASGNMAAITATGLSGVRVEPSTEYTAGFQLRSAVSARTCRARITWYDSTGASISDSDGTGATSDTASWTAYTVTATSPSTAVYAALAAEVDGTAAANEQHRVDAAFFHSGSATSYGDRIGFLAMHGNRLFGATYTPFETGATSLQVFSYDDLHPDNRDASQAISGNSESAEWDLGLPMEVKGLIGFYVTYEVTDSGTTFGIVANSRIKIEYSRDDAAYETAATLTSATTPVGEKGRHFIQISDGTTTKKFTRLKVKTTLDNNSTAVAPPVLFGVTVEAQPLAYARTWTLRLRMDDEDSNERGSSRQEASHQIRDRLVALATNKDLVTFLDGYDRPNNTYNSHTVIVEDPRFHIIAPGRGIAQVKLRSVV